VGSEVAVEARNKSDSVRSASDVICTLITKSDTAPKGIKDQTTCILCNMRYKHNCKLRGRPVKWLSSKLSIAEME
jgi:hypothetical protein